MQQDSASDQRRDASILPYELACTRYDTAEHFEHCGPLMSHAVMTA